MAAMSTLSTGIDELIAAHLTEQCEAHVAIAEALERASRRPGRQTTALRRMDAHVEIARRYQLLARAVREGHLEWLADVDDTATAALKLLEEMAGTTR